ncbi:MAG: hypothetical protein KDD44_12370, partial [Bdellovibrionales bacterium]|nr:hypothetical protein [Bdellovibrionales bacterium]
MVIRRFSLLTALCALSLLLPVYSAQSEVPAKGARISLTLLQSPIYYSQLGDVAAPRSIALRVSGVSNISSFQIDDVLLNGKSEVSSDGIAQSDLVITRDITAQSVELDLHPYLFQYAVEGSNSFTLRCRVNGETLDVTLPLIVDNTPPDIQEGLNEILVTDDNHKVRIVTKTRARSEAFEIPRSMRHFGFTPQDGFESLTAID